MSNVKIIVSEYFYDKQEKQRDKIAEQDMDTGLKSRDVKKIIKRIIPKNDKVKSFSNVEAYSRFAIMTRCAYDIANEMKWNIEIKILPSHIGVIIFSSDIFNFLIPCEERMIFESLISKSDDFSISIKSREGKSDLVSVMLSINLGIDVPIDKI